jgi:hypothetical protein
MTFQHTRPASGSRAAHRAKRQYRLRLPRFWFCAAGILGRPADMRLAPDSSMPIMRAMSDEERSSSDPMKLFRKSYTEEDIEALLSSPRFVVACDAYGAGCCSLQEMTTLAFTAPPYIPCNLEPLTFADLVFEIVERIRSGKMEIPESWKQEFSHFYVQRRVRD